MRTAREGVGTVRTCERSKCWERGFGRGLQFGKDFAEGRPRYAILRDYGGDVAVGSYVEGDVSGADVWGGAYAGCMRDFCRGALFDGNLIAS